MIERIRRFVATKRKAIIAVAVGAIAAQAVRSGIELTSAQTDWLTMVLTGVSVYLIPNER